jgi:D-sedoheptulose 7-phosphate isomerase
MRQDTLTYLDELIVRYPELKDAQDSIQQAADLLIYCFRNHGKLLICGNGGSAADSLHIVGELMKGFSLRRELDVQLCKKLESLPDALLFTRNLQRALPAIALTCESSLITATANDTDADLIFAQQVLGYGQAGDVLLAISTSGNSRNVVLAAELAHVLDLKVVGLTGCAGGALQQWSDVLISAKTEETYKVQELHLPIYHALCLAVENEIFGRSRE